MNKTPSQEIDDIVTLYSGWKGNTMASLRSIISSVDPSITEEVKWKMRTRPEGLPVWYSNGIVCLLETFKNDMKLVFTKGAFMQDRQGVFNARLNSKTDRAIELHVGDTIPAESIRDFVTQALQLNADATHKKSTA